MSVHVMSQVFQRYPSGGGEMLLALALADHADDEGRRIYPAVATLAQKTRQSERTVQYQLRKMEKEGWLLLVANEFGGRNHTRQYRIHPDWIKGADFAPIQNGANDDTKGCNQTYERVQPDVLKGAIAVAPESSRIINNHQETSKRVRATYSESPKPAARLIDLGVDPQVAADWLEVRKAKKAPLTQTALDTLCREAAKAGVSVNQAVQICCARNWQGFQAQWLHNSSSTPAAKDPRMSTLNQIWRNHGNERPIIDVTTGGSDASYRTGIPETVPGVR